MFNRNKKLVFVIIIFKGVNGAFDYPKHLPIPKKDDTVLLNGNYGKVELVKHLTEGDVSQIYIECGNP